MDKWGTVDILVNNAGITRDTLMMRMKAEQVSKKLDCQRTLEYILFFKALFLVYFLTIVVDILVEAFEMNL